ncbi:tetratricopeptide repeat protein [Acidobacteriota bacterium]
MGFYSALPPKDAFPKAKAAAIKAMELDEELAEAHTSLAYAMLYYDWDWQGAEQEFKRADALNPDYATTPHWLAEYLAAMGMMSEAIAAKNRASQLDPLSMIINTTIGWMYYFSRQYDEAIAQIKKVLEIDPNFVPAHFWIGQAYEQKGLYQEAVDEFKKAVTLSGESTYTLASLAHAYASAGEKVRAREILSQLRELSKDKYVSAYEIAEVYISLGEIDSAFEWLQKAFEEKSRALVYLKVEPRLDPIRSDPRFKTLLNKMNLE